MHGRQCQPPRSPLGSCPSIVCTLSTTYRDALEMPSPSSIISFRGQEKVSSIRHHRARYQGPRSEALAQASWLLLRPSLPSSRQLAWLLAEPRTNRGPSPVSHQCPVPSESLVWQGLPRCMTDPQPDPLLIHRPLATRLFPPGSLPRELLPSWPAPYMTVDTQ